MDRRHSSPSRPSPNSRFDSPRPRTCRQRSNSFPIVDALGCSTPEALLILAEGRAAVRSRNASARRRGRRNRSEDDDITTFRPQDHLKYLGAFFDSQEAEEEPTLSGTASTRHSRVDSNATDDSVSTIVALPGAGDGIQSPVFSPTTPLGDYSANLAKFIQSQLMSIPSYHNAALSPRSCPDLTLRLSTPPQSPIRRRPMDTPSIIEIPPIRPPLRSAFSAWSSTDDDETDDETPPPPSLDSIRNDNKMSNHSTPAILHYYENMHDSSFLFSTTPLDESKGHEDAQHPNADGFCFPCPPSLQPASASESLSPTRSPNLLEDDDYPSSGLSSRPQLSCSSAPSFSSSTSTSYFDCKLPLTLAPNVRDRIIAAVSPRPTQKILTATSPFEGGALANVHEILIESQHRVLVDGLSFDLVSHYGLPNESLRAAPHVTTPC